MKVSKKQRQLLIKLLMLRREEKLCQWESSRIL